MDSRILAATCLLFIIACCPLSAVSAEEGCSIDAYNLTIIPLSGTAANGELTISVNAGEDATLPLAFGYALSELQIYSDLPIEYEYLQEDSSYYVYIIFPEAGQYAITISYVADMFSTVSAEKYVYAPTFSFFCPVSSFVCKVIVPENMSLVSPLVPDPHTVYSEGPSVVATWERSDVNNGFYLLVGLKEDAPCSSLRWFYVPLAAIICLVIGIVAGLRMYRGKEPSECPDFKTDESAIMDILSHNGPTSQGEIVAKTGFSKAKVSRIIMELEARNVLEKEKYKNRNIVKIKK